MLLHILYYIYVLQFVFIGDRWILTAAHCVEEAMKFEVVAGDYDLYTNDPNEVRRTSSQYIMHHQWNSNTLKADIALIRIDKLKFNGNCQMASV